MLEKRSECAVVSVCVWLCMSSGMLGTVNFGEVRKRRNKEKI